MEILPASAVLAIYGQGDDKPTLKSVIKQILTFPPVICLLAALALRSVSLPDSFILLLKTLAATLVPVVMIAVGFLTHPATQCRRTETHGHWFAG